MLANRLILIVEDNPFIAYDLANAVVLAGGRVAGPALSLAEAAILIDEGNVDAALLDIDLRSEQVWPVAERLKSMSTPIVFISSHSDQPGFPDRFSAYPRMTKPATPVDAMDTLAQYMGRV